MDIATLATLRSLFGDRMQENDRLSSYTSARIGGPADALIFVYNAEDLREAATKLWELGVPFLVLGGGSNVLVSDRGVRGAVIVNRARLVRFDSQAEPPVVRAESGATLNDIAQRAARLGLSGLEWAASVPGSLGGAVYGNAGAYGGDTAGSLVSAELLFPSGAETWPAERLQYAYRSSLLKRERPQAVLLAATLKMSRGDRASIQARMEANGAKRRSSQPRGASMGSMFKNPPGQAAGQLIEAAGLKGTRLGRAQISSQHANFFINDGETRAEDMRALIELAQKEVYEKCGVLLELEVELIGEW
jgi:UDP-N-acetylmuramate dehydrogenase